MCHRVQYSLFHCLCHKALPMLSCSTCCTHIPLIIGILSARAAGDWIAIEPRIPSHLISKVNHNEGDVGHARLLKVRAARVLLVELLGPVLIRSPRHLKEGVRLCNHRGGEIKLSPRLPALWIRDSSLSCCSTSSPVTSKLQRRPGTNREAEWINHQFWSRRFKWDKHPEKINK